MKTVECQEEEIFISKEFFLHWVKYLLNKKKL